MTEYIALLRKDPASDYGVEFPDFPGCVTAGRTLEEARRMATEALDLHVSGMVEDRAPLPEPSSLDAVMRDPASRDTVAFLVEASARPSKAVRINVTLPEDLLQAIDRRTTNRSRFLAEAATLKLHDAAQPAKPPPTPEAGEAKTLTRGRRGPRPELASLGDPPRSASRKARQTDSQGEP